MKVKIKPKQEPTSLIIKLDLNEATDIRNYLAALTDAKIHTNLIAEGFTPKDIEHITGTLTDLVLRLEKVLA